MEYPIIKFHFSVEWGGNRISATEISGLSSEIEVIEYREGSSKESIRSLMPGLKIPNRITLKRGVVKGDNEYFQWLSTVNMD